MKSIVTKAALVCGAGGFIGSHLVRRLKKDGYWVRGVDLKRPEFSLSSADEFLLLDLRQSDNCRQAVEHLDGVTEVYQLAADMGGMGFIHAAECEIMRNNVLINTHMVHAAAMARISQYFFSSSVCVYPNMNPGDPPKREEDAYPACPDNEYGWEKLYSERVALAYGRRTGMQIRIARFENTYGPEGTWQGGREKAPAALCRKVAQAVDGDEVEIWGDGEAVRCYTYVDDLVDGIVHLMHSNISYPTNIGSGEYVTVNQLLATVMDVAGKCRIRPRYVVGPVGVASRNFSRERILSTGWHAKTSLRAGITRTYDFVEGECGNV